MNEQMTIFDLLPEISLDDLPEEEMVKRIRDATGIDFQYRDDFWKWEYRKKKVRYSVHYSNYHPEVHEGKRFISCGYDYGTGGSGHPIDSLEGAIKFFREAKNRFEQGGQS